MSIIKPYKNRSIDTNKKVRVHRNLGKQVKEAYSIKQNGLVVGHADEIYLINGNTHIIPSAQAQAIRERTRNVHAFIEGFVAENLMPNNSSEFAQITYNPFEHKDFVYKKSYSRIISMQEVIIKPEGVFIK
jgi:hypothetical protein